MVVNLLPIPFAVLQLFPKFINFQLPFWNCFGLGKQLLGRSGAQQRLRLRVYVRLQNNSIHKELQSYTKGVSQVYIAGK
jgi:hypothetical protein